MSVTGHDQLKARRTLKVDGKDYDYFSLDAAAKAAGLGDIARLPFSMKVLLENLVRLENGRTVTLDDIKAMAEWLKTCRSEREIAFRPARVLMQDFTGVPAVVDLAAMRQAMAKLGGDPQRINPLSPVDLVIDHSVMVDAFASPKAFTENVKLEFERNGERYAFLKWGQDAFDNFRVVPPGTGICHQVNLEYLAQVVWTTEEGGKTVAYPDTLVGTDSHTTMVNGLAVLGWGVGGIEAEAAMLGQPISMVLPEVMGFKLSGKLKEGATATDLVLTVTQMLRKKGVVGRFVELRPAAGEAGRGLCQGAGLVARRKGAGSRFHRHARTRSRQRRAVARRATPAAGPRGAVGSRQILRRGAAQARGHDGFIEAQSRRACHRYELRRQGRRRRHRRHHQLHQHLEPQRHACRRPPGA